MPVPYSFTDIQFGRFQKLARPLIDTMEILVDDALDALEAARGVKKGAPTGAVSPLLMPGDPPSLKHTTLRHAEVNGEALSKSSTSWNALLNAAVGAAASKGISSEKLHHLIGVPTTVGERSDTGYTFIAPAGISIQGQNADKAWREARRLAQAGGFKITAEFVWQQKVGAAFPGQTETLVA